MRNLFYWLGCYTFTSKHWLQANARCIENQEKSLQGWILCHGTVHAQCSAGCKKKKKFLDRWFKKTKDPAIECQPVWLRLVQHFCQSRHVVFLFTLHQRTGKAAERQFKRPWPEPYCIAVTFTASHIMSELFKNPLLPGRFNRPNRLSSALPHSSRLVPSNLDLIHSE